MLSLDKDLQKKKTSLNEFESVVIRVLSYLPNVLSGYEEKSGYLLYYSHSAGVKKFVRPIKTDLFIMNTSEFSEKINTLKTILNRIRDKQNDFSDDECFLIDSVLYTIQQAIGAGFDLLIDPNNARKHVGNRFEELIKVVFTSIGIPNKKVTIKIPYDMEQGTKNYTCENDLILSPFANIPVDNEVKPIVLNVIDLKTGDNEVVLSPSAEALADKYINTKEIVVSVKTTSKDRMGKMFMDKILLERFVGHDLKVIGIFLNDVQRKGVANISYTLVSGLFMVYNQFITQLNGVYYLDPPPGAFKEPYNKHIKRFSTLITQEIASLLSA
ncbi:hypothetical protein [Mucilaginibacter psychrotolerans]|uniref:Restriction endonuclease n=1 Tax=Mucilaginibacter psychrotolerans TaxID=1524096 RepID=A0A4Y8SNN6_9SPHI|nr:hypothetical protein [Mucilaginibacter psychrotolerans]TFF40241.1 hypothetical protein E2R66_03035 [Mucilaginibacter psychrotolerans]